MGRTTEIEWTEHTWNPMVGCSRVSAGCVNCYAAPMAARVEAFGSAPHYSGVTCHRNGRPDWSGKIALASESVWGKPYKLPPRSLVFVNSMSDFWHEHAPIDGQRRALDIVRATNHTYQVLTKRPQNIAPRLTALGPLPANFWAGVTVEDRRAVARIAILREIPASVRFLSCEPLLEDLGDIDLSGIQWVIAGGESGPRARPACSESIRHLRDQCVAAGVPFFFKQWGQPRNNPLFSGDRDALAKLDPIGKGGSLLDGRHWKEAPGRFAA